jgi:hypothetical protein
MISLQELALFMQLKIRPPALADVPARASTGFQAHRPGLQREFRHVLP